MNMSCRLEALKRRYAPDIEADTADYVNQENTIDSINSSPLAKRQRTLDVNTLSTALNSAPSSSSATRYGGVFDAVDLSTNEINSYLRAETRALRRRKLVPKRALPPSNNAGTSSFGSSFERRRSPDKSASSDSDGEGLSAPLRVTSEASTSNEKTSTLEQKKEFSLVDVENIVRRLLAEQKMRLTHEFETVLQRKLQEQAEAFMRYTADAVQRNMDANKDRHLSYLS